MQIEQKPYPKRVVIIGEHIKDCWSEKYVHQPELAGNVLTNMKEKGWKLYPWNMLEAALIHCDPDGNKLTKDEVAERGHAEIWYEFSCGNGGCGCKKRINSKFIGGVENTPNIDEIITGFNNLNAQDQTEVINRVNITL